MLTDSLQFDYFNRILSQQFETLQLSVRVLLALMGQTHKHTIIINSCIDFQKTSIFIKILFNLFKKYHIYQDFIA